MSEKRRVNPSILRFHNPRNYFAKNRPGWQKNHLKVGEFIQSNDRVEVELCINRSSINIFVLIFCHDDEIVVFLKSLK